MLLKRDLRCEQNISSKLPPVLDIGSCRWPQDPGSSLLPAQRLARIIGSAWPQPRMLFTKHRAVCPDLSGQKSRTEAHEPTASFLELIQQEQPVPAAEGTLCSKADD